MKHRRKWMILGGIALVLAGLAGYGIWHVSPAGQVYRSRPLGTVMRVEPAQAVKLDVQTDWGEHREITSLQEIQSVAAVLGNCRYLRVAPPPSSSGYLDRMTFYDADGRSSSITVAKFITIDTGYYQPLGGLDTDRLQKALGLPIPGQTG